MYTQDAPETKHSLTCVKQEIAGIFSSNFD